LFQIASHCSVFKAAEGRPDVMVFACASTQVAVKGSTTREMTDALNILTSSEVCRGHPNTQQADKFDAEVDVG
jgi:hypothetical protein